MKLTWWKSLCGTFRTTRRKSQAIRPDIEALELRDLPSATLWTDKADYHPGSVATIYGSGYAPGESVQLEVVHLDSLYSNVYPAWTVTDGGAGDLDGLLDGNIQTTWQVGDIPDSTLQATGTGLTSHETAQTIFTDTPPVEAVLVTPATGGETIPASSAGGAYTTLDGPVLTETTPGDLTHDGTIVLTVPAGYEWDTGGSDPTATVTNASTHDTNLIVSYTSRTSTTVTFTVEHNSEGQNKQGMVTFGNLRVRPILGSGLAGGNITNTGSAAPTGETNYGTLNQVDTGDPIPAIVTLDNLAATYDGSAHFATATTTPSGLNVVLVYSQNGNVVASPTNAGSYDVTATIDDGNYTGSVTGTLIISPAEATIDLGDLTATYDGNAHFASATTGPGGLTVVLVYSQNGNVVANPTDAGSYDVSATIDEANYTGSTTGTLVISQAEATIDLSDLTTTYDGNAHFATATTGPVGLPVVLVYSQNGNVVANPTDAGSYDVSATINDANYTGSTTGTLVISQAEATIDLGDLTTTYDGNAHFATATTGPVGLTVVLVYSQNGNVVANPTDAGSYDVSATIDDLNYTGSTTGTLIISQAEATIDLGDLTATYDGNAHFASATTGPGGLTVILVYSQNGNVVANPTDAGSYDVSATVDDANYAGSTTGTLVISQAEATIDLSDLTATYDGNAHFATATTGPVGLTVVLVYSQNGNVVANPTDAGSYDVSATIDDPNYTGSTTGTLIISQAEATIDLSDLTATYDGNAHFVSATTGPGGLTVVLVYSQSGNVVANPTDAGSYDVSATIDNPNYTGATTGTLVISQAEATIDLSDLTATYDGNAHIATATTGPGGLTVVLVYSQNGNVVANPTNAGSYDVSATIDDANYTGSTTGTLVIDKATATVQLGNLSATFDGNAHFATTTTTPSGLTVVVTYSQSGSGVASPTAAGSYDVSAIIDDANYAGSITGTLVIDEVPIISGETGATVVLDDLTATYDGNAHFATATTTPNGLVVAITYTQNGNAVANPTNAGSYDVSATIDDDTYTGSATGTLVISKATPTFSGLSGPTIPQGTKNVVLGGSIQAGSLIPGGKVAITLNGVTKLARIQPNGGFSATFATSKLQPAGSPYTITYAFAGNNNFAAVTDTSKHLTVNPAVALKVLSQATSVRAGLPIPITIQLVDVNGEAVLKAGVRVTISVDVGKLHGTLTVRTNAKGQARFVNLRIYEAGVYTLTAHSGELAPAIAEPITIFLGESGRFVRHW